MILINYFLSSFFSSSENDENQFTDYQMTMKAKRVDLNESEQNFYHSKFGKHTSVLKISRKHFQWKKDFIKSHYKILQNKIKANKNAFHKIKFPTFFQLYDPKPMSYISRKKEKKYLLVLKCFVQFKWKHCGFTVENKTNEFIVSSYN